MNVLRDFGTRARVAGASREAKNEDLGRGAADDGEKDGKADQAGKGIGHLLSRVQVAALLATNAGATF